MRLEPTDPNLQRPNIPPVTPNPSPLVEPTPPPAPEQPPVEQTPPPSVGQRVGSVLTEVAKAIFSWAILPLIIVLILHTFVFQAFRVVGASMTPTLQEADYLIISKVGASVARATRPTQRNSAYIPKRGEVVVFRYPKNPDLVFVKRVIALPGDRVLIKGGHVAVYPKNELKGFNPDEGTPLSGVTTEGDIDEIIPAGHVFVLGDNRSLRGSFDSREWGSLPSGNIIGQAVLRLLPLDKIKWISAGSSVLAGRR